MIGSGLAALRIERTGLEENVGTRSVEPFGDVRQNLQMRALRPVAVEQRERIEAFGIGDPARAARSDSGEAPTNVVAAAQLRFFSNKQTKKRAANIAESDDGKVVERNGCLVIDAVRLFADGSVKFLRD